MAVAHERGEDELDLVALAVDDRLDVVEKAVRDRPGALEALGLGGRAHDRLHRGDGSRGRR